MSLTETIKTVFTEDKYIVNNLLDELFFITSIDEKECVTMTIYEDNIELNTLKKCQLSGTHSLKLVEKLARLLNKRQIILLDMSSIIISCEGQTYKIDLALLKIFTNGKSWYNSHGYMSQNYEDEKEHNSKIRNFPCGDIIEKVILKRIDSFLLSHSIEQYERKMERYIQAKLVAEKRKDLLKQQKFYEEELKISEILANHREFVDEKVSEIIETGYKLLADAERLFPRLNINEVPARLYVESVYTDIMNDSEMVCDKVRVLKDLLDTLKREIKYDPNLIKTVMTGGRKSRFLSTKVRTRKLSSR
jgi:hypothetical protein